MASDKLMNHTQGETIIGKLTAIADSLDDLAAVTPAKLGMGIATCDTPGSTVAKTAALANFALVEGAPVSVQFTYANTAANATLNINNTGAKPIIYKDAAIGNDVISAGDTCTFIYTTNTYKITNIDTLTGPGSGTVRQVGAENGLITDQSDNADIQTTGKIGLNLKSDTAFSTEVSAHNTSTDNMYPVALDSEGHPVAAVSTMSASGTGHKGGLVPDPGNTAGTKKYLAENGEWKAPDTEFASTPTVDTIPSSKLVKDSLDAKVAGPVSSTQNNIATYSDASGKTVKDSGVHVVDYATGADTAKDDEVPTSKAANKMITDKGYVVGPSSVTGDTIALFDSTTGKLIKSSSKTFDSSAISNDANKVPTSKLVYEGLGGKVPTTRTINGKDLSSNVTLSGDDLKLTNYSKTTSKADLAATDKVNQAFDKLENRIVANQTNIQSILDGTTIDSFGDVETALGGKQATLSTAQLAAVNSGIDSTKVGQIATNTSDISSLQDAVDTKLDKTANAASAAKLNNGTTDYTVGSATKGVYFNNGVPTEMTYSVGTNVPAEAVFTDTTYSSGSGITVNSSHQINHSNSVTAKTTASALKVSYDAQGHITGSSALAASDVGAIATTAKGVANGVAELDSTGKVPSSQLPSYVDDVLEYSAKSSFPAEGETGKIYVDTSDNKTYRWGGTAYVEISPSLALGTTSSTAYYGDKGKTAYDHSQVTSGNPHNVTKTDVGLGNVGNFKAVSTVASQGLSDTEKANARANIGAGTSSLSLGTSSATAYRGDYGNTAYSHATDSSRLTTATSSGLYKVASTAQGHIASLTAVVKADITALGIPAQDTTYGVVSTSANGLAPKVTDTSKFLKGDGTWATPTNTWTAMVGATSSANGSVGYVNATPPKDGYNTKYLRADGSWQVPPNTTYSAATTSAAGLMSADDKTKLNGIATGAQVNSITGVKGNSESSYRTGNVNLTAANVGAAASSHTHGNIQNGGTLQSNDITIGQNDKLVVTDYSDSHKIARASISFDGSTATQALTKKGTWETFNNYTHPSDGANTGSFGPSASVSPGFGGTFSVPYVTVNAKGHVTAASSKTITMPNFTATTYTQPTKHSNITSIDSGGYIQIGKLVIVNMRFTVGTACGQYTDIFTDLPLPLTSLSGGSACVACSSNNNTLMICANGRMQNYDSGSLAAGVYVVSTVYIGQ